MLSDFVVKCVCVCVFTVCVCVCVCVERDGLVTCKMCPVNYIIFVNI